LEPLLESAEKMLTDIDEAKGQVEKVGMENEELLKDPIIVKTVDIVAKKSTHVKYKVEDISGKFQELEKSLQEAHTT